MTLKKTLLFPSYLPSIASFAAMVQHEVIWEVSGNYQKQSLRNRAYITNDRGIHSLTIPVQGKGELSHRPATIKFLLTILSLGNAPTGEPFKLLIEPLLFLSIMSRILNHYLPILTTIY